MMARTASAQFVCQSCGAIYGKWAGKCEACSNWNTLIEEIVNPTPSGMSKRSGEVIELTDLSKPKEGIERIYSGMGEFNRVCGGGLVPGSTILLGGDPGIGKSTLLLQLLAKIDHIKYPCVYITGEEAVDQIRLRAKRLGIVKQPISVMASTDIRDILISLEKIVSPSVVVIDSIQTMYVNSFDAAPGTVTQVRSSAQELIGAAKRLGVTVLLVGHVTKEGQIAGPRVLEHMVDTVLYFEGDHSNQHRILRSVKNRFGPTDEIGVFEMTNIGLSEVTNPSQLFLSNQHQNINGVAVFAGIEGTRPVLVEIQALVAHSALATPRRTVIGWDSGRLAMILAVLETCCGITLGTNDVYLNVAGGFRISEPAADLAVAAAVLSSYVRKPMPEETVVFGEVGLSSEVRIVKQASLRLKEASKLGFKRAFVPSRTNAEGSIRVTEIKELSQLTEMFCSTGITNNDT